MKTRRFLGLLLVALAGALAPAACSSPSTSTDAVACYREDASVACNSCTYDTPCTYGRDGGR